MRKVAANSYLVTNKLLLKLANELEGKFKVAFSITGIALDQFELYAPEVIDSFKKLAKTGCVEFLSETYSHSLSSLKNKDIFRQQVSLHEKRIFELFGQKPLVFRNTEMIYSDEIGAQVADMGYKGMLTEGAKHVLGWKSPNFLYVNALNPRLKILMRNFKLSDDISFRFSNKNWSEFPLTADKFIGWIEKLNPKEEVINLFLSYESFGERQKKESGIFDFLEHFARKVIKNRSLRFATPTELLNLVQPVSVVSVTHPISWADEERDLTAWLGNSMQNEAFEKLYCLASKMEQCTDNSLIKDWNYLQVSDHFYYMSTKIFSDGEIHSYFNPFNSPFEAFINYMNILSDFTIRVNVSNPENEIEQEIAALQRLLDEKDKKIKRMELDLIKIQKSKNRKTAKKSDKAT
jgi:alpha-amylase